MGPEVLVDERGERTDAEALASDGPVRPPAAPTAAPVDPVAKSADLASTPVDAAAAPSSAWIAPPGPRRGRSLFSTVVTIGAVLIGVLVVIAVLGINSGFFLPRGQVLFGTAAGTNLCSVAGETRTITSSDPVFFAAILKHRMAGTEAITLTVTRDGEPFFDNVEPADGTQFECYGSRESVGPLEPGVYVFTITHNADVEATGTLTVT